MEKSTSMGMNRTGADMSPVHSREMASGAKEMTPPGSRAGAGLAEPGRAYILEADPVGSVPMPGTIKGALKSAMDKFTGHNPEVLINKLGERLAFERSGVRLYDSLLRKCDALASVQDIAPVSIRDLEEMRDEEAEHFRLLRDAIESLGADPTAQTPDADVSGMAATGFRKVIADPRTSLSQCLEAMLGVEMMDNAAWELLIALCNEMNLDDMAKTFGHALRQEEVHMKRVLNWYENSVLMQASRMADTRH